ncbi:MAG: hypothetical protein OWV35_12255, partial [Firmicutes bacterium]|nr:hypothetical protein [Bacillota bacterium]
RQYQHAKAKLADWPITHSNLLTLHRHARQTVRRWREQVPYAAALPEAALRSYVGYRLLQRCDRDALMELRQREFRDSLRFLDTLPFPLAWFTQKRIAYLVREAADEALTQGKVHPQLLGAYRAHLRRALRQALPDLDRPPADPADLAAHFRPAEQLLAALPVPEALRPPRP